MLQENVTTDRAEDTKYEEGKKGTEDVSAVFSYKEKKALLEEYRSRTAKERSEFLDAWLADPICYVIK